LSYLRFTPHDFATLTSLCRQHRLGERNLPTFKRLLVAALEAVAPELGRRVAGLRGSRLELLFHHFRDRTPLLPRAEPPEFTPEELVAVAEACQATPFPVRLVRPFKGVLIERFEGEWPDLARKLRWLSGQEFELLYGQLGSRGEGI